MRSAFVYTREAHPSDEWPHHTSFEQKLAHARHLAAYHAIARPMWVDDLAGTVHRAYGALPNMAYVVHRGRVLYRANWAQADAVRAVLDNWLLAEAWAAEGQESRHFWAEWAARRPRRRGAFVRAMATEVGQRAVEEFIAAIAQSEGRAAADELRAFWAAVRAAD